MDAATAGKPEHLPYQIIDDGPAQGAPLGGIGTGTIGRTYRGDFARWHIEAGKHHYQSAAADQFSVYVAQNGERHAQVLSSARPTACSKIGTSLPLVAPITRCTRALGTIIRRARCRCG